MNSELTDVQGDNNYDDFNRSVVENTINYFAFRQRRGVNNPLRCYESVIRAAIRVLKCTQTVMYLCS